MIKIYCLIEPIGNKPFYVGATKYRLKTRLYQHINDTAYGKDYLISEKYPPLPAAKRAILIQQLIKEGFKPQIQTLLEVEKCAVNHYESFFYRMFVGQGYNMLQEPRRFVYQTMKSGPTNKCLSLVAINTLNIIW